jgi:hypothetical protein
VSEARTFPCSLRARSAPSLPLPVVPPDRIGQPGRARGIAQQRPHELRIGSLDPPTTCARGARTHRDDERRALNKVRLESAFAALAAESTGSVSPNKTRARTRTLNSPLLQGHAARSFYGQADDSGNAEPSTFLFVRERPGRFPFDRGVDPCLFTCVSHASIADSRKQSNHRCGDAEFYLSHEPIDSVRRPPQRSASCAIESRRWRTITLSSLI